MSRKEPPNDPIGDIYRILDQAGLSGGTLLNGKQPILTIVNGIRTKIAKLLNEYVMSRETDIYEAGYRQGKEDQKNGKTRI
jgi:hypothetical protein